jgi:hypothetical protein
LNINHFELPPALAGEKEMNFKLALAKIRIQFWLKPLQTTTNFIPPAEAGGNLILKKTNS